MASQDASEVSISTLPKDALLSILYHLNPSDILRLDEALPSTATIARNATQDPCLWRYLYRIHIPRPRSPPQLHITQDGRIDWRNAFQQAIRRQHAIHIRNQLNYQQNDNNDNNNKKNSTNKQKANHNVTIQTSGNVRRIIANTNTNATNITWDSHIAAARFDWTQQQDNALSLRRVRRSPIVPSRTLPPRHARSSSSP